MIQIVGLGRGRGASFIPGVPRKMENAHQVLTRYGELVDKTPTDQRWNIFFTAAHHKGAHEANVPVRTKSTFDYQEMLFWDIDEADTDRWEEYSDVMAEVFDINKRTFRILNSGNGLHFIVFLETPLQEVDYFESNKKYYNHICETITQKIADRNLPGYADSIVFEPSRIIRIPGFVNIKEGKEKKMAMLLQHSEATIDLDLRLISGLKLEEESNLSPQTVRRDYPIPDFKQIYKDCEFIKWAATSPEEIHEPQAFDLMSLLSNMPADIKVVHKEEEKTARELAYWVMDNAVSSASLRGAKFETKWSNAAKYGVRKCDSIDKNWTKCISCKHYGLIPTPLAIRSNEHIGSSNVGYWVKDNKGRYLHPNYQDLVNLFKDKYKVKCSADERIYYYEDGIYRRTLPLEVKQLFDSSLEPQYPIRETHRVEFLHKLKAETCINKEEEEEFFSENTRSKVCFNNGVYDFARKEFIAHSCSIGFKTKVPHDYIPNQKSDFFIEWLDRITLQREGLKRIILDFMAYCIWPRYEEHIFVILQGDGRNGKSTLLDLLRAILGKENTSAVSLNMLVNNRFAPARLEGKFANISDEGSGVVLGKNQLNIIKTLSSGEPHPVEEKGKDGYDMTNTAKLIFSVNIPPEINEDTNALKRRIVVIPFDYIIQNMDDSIKENLIKEASKILSMLIDHVSLILKENDGKFRIKRDINEVREASRNMIHFSNNIAQWAYEELDTNSVATFELIDELYILYRQWCTEEGMRYPETRKCFSRQLKNVLPSTGIEFVKKRFGNKVRPVVWGVRVKGIINDSKKE